MREIKETSNEGASPWSQTCFLCRKKQSWNSLSKGVLFSAGIALLQLKKHPVVNQNVEIDIFTC